MAVQFQLDGVVEAITGALGQQKRSTLRLQNEQVFPNVESGTINFSGTAAIPYALNLGGITKVRQLVLHASQGSGVRALITTLAGTNQIIPMSDWLILGAGKPGDEILYVGLIGSGEIEYMVVGESSGAGSGGQPLGSASSVALQYNCPAGVNVLDVVYVSGADTVDQAVAVASPLREPIGIVTGKPTPTTCFVLVLGEVTGFAGLTPGSIYWLSPTTPGAITSTPPATTGQIQIRLGVARNATTLMFEIDSDPAIL